MNNTKGMTPERLERISNYARWLIENTGKGQRRGLAEAYLALEARCREIQTMAAEARYACDHNLKSVVSNYLKNIAASAALRDN